jgi:putative ABC transport system substrate-binding protein
VGILWHAGSEAEEAIYLGAVRKGFQDLGYIEGSNLIIENRYPDEKPELFVQYGKELADSNPDVLMAITRPAVAAVQKATSSIPIVMMAPDPVGSGFVASLAQPGGNITGYATVTVELSPKRLQLMKEGLPTIRKVALLVNTLDSASSRTSLEKAMAVAPRLNVSIEAVQTNGAASVLEAFDEISRRGFDASAGIGAVETATGQICVSDKTLTEREAASLSEAERIEGSKTLRGTEEEDTTPDVFRTDQAPLT